MRFDLIILLLTTVPADRTKEICEEHGFRYVDLPINLRMEELSRPAINMHGRTGMTWQCRWMATGSVQHGISGIDGRISGNPSGRYGHCFRFIEKNPGFIESSGMRRVGSPVLFRADTADDRKATIADPTCGLRMAGRELDRIIFKGLSKGLSGTGKCCGDYRKGLKVAEVPVIMREREGGVSSISMKKSVYYMVKVTLAILIERIRR